MANQHKNYHDSDHMQLRPLDVINGFEVRPGIYELNGATALTSGVNFTVETKEGSEVTLLLFKRERWKPYAKIPFPKSYKIGNVYSMIVFGLDVEEFEYAYSVDGPYAPEKGLLFDKKYYLLDPYARAVTGQSTWGVNMGPKVFYKARVVKNNYDWGKEVSPLIPMEDLVIYEMHVRGFTYDPSSGVKCPGTFAGIMEKIPYLKELGINAVELMPVFEFDETKEMREVDGHKVLNYWGYNTVSFFAPNTSYSSSIEYNREGLELKKLINALNDNGIEVYLDVVFNHTAEGDENGPFFSFKGFDNRIWYMLKPDGSYLNYSGCGNTMNCNHPMVQKMIIDCLRYWTTEYHVNGFRFDLASILGRSQTGEPLSSPPLLETLAGDPLLANVKLIAEAWDAGGLYQVGSFPSWNRWSEWNGRYRDDMRDFLKGGHWKAYDAMYRMLGSPDMYDPEGRGCNASINFISCHDGFTLYDIYSYNEKHNEANGWDNTDGSNDNRSWNCGAEGPTDDPEVNTLRRKLCKNAMAALLMSRGIPMFLAGDEFLNSQFGNNNPYCQDNEISWLNWNDLEKNRDHFEFVRFMIRFRRLHPVICRPGSEKGAIGLEEVTVYEPYDESKVTGIIYADHFEDGSPDIAAIMLNVYWEPQPVKLPKLPPGMHWYAVADTSQKHIKTTIACSADLLDQKPYIRNEFRIRGRHLVLEPRSIMILTAE